MFRSFVQTILGKYVEPAVNVIVDPPAPSPLRTDIVMAPPDPIVESPIDAAPLPDSILTRPTVNNPNPVFNDTEPPSPLDAVSAVETNTDKKLLMEHRESSNLFKFVDGTIVNFNFVSISKDSNVDSLFVEGDIWESRELLFKAARVVANKQGFTVIRCSNRIECNRAGTIMRKNDIKERKMRGGALKTGCTWQIRISSLTKTLDSIGKKYRTDKFHESARVKIIKACCDHTNCMPSAQNKNITARRAGEYIKNIPKHQLWSLVLTMKNNNMRLSSSHIKGVLRGCFPSSFVITKQHVHYTRLKAWRLYKLLGDDPQWDIFEQSMSNPEIETSINNEAYTDDEAVSCFSPSRDGS